jgi:hypothetical protein
LSSQPVRVERIPCMFTQTPFFVCAVAVGSILEVWLCLYAISGSPVWARSPQPRGNRAPQTYGVVKSVGPFGPDCVTVFCFHAVSNCS